MALDHRVELVPVDRAEIVMAALGVPLQVRIGHRQPQVLGLRHGLVDHFLAQFVVGEQLDLPLHRLRAVGRVGVGGAEHHQRRPPPAIERLLAHGLLLGRAVQAHLDQQIVALALVERLFLAHAHHGARVGAVRTSAQRDLVDDGRAIDQPADHADIGPCQGGIVEDAGVLGAARVQIVDQVLARNAQRLGRAVEIQAVPGLVLHLGQQDRLALERRRAGDPVALGQHADDLGMGVLGNLAHQGLAIGLGHPVLGFDAHPVVDTALERLLGAFQLIDMLDLADPGFDQLSVHICLLRRGCARRWRARTFRRLMHGII
ncbi:Uncharacterised protein [Bordetella pertussis]|nr:Uncharacterised protein [Bordetella pertussis]